MKIKELLDSPKVTISCELFPPKKGTELQNAMDIVHAIAIDGVDYMSVTYGAGGTAVGKSLAIASEVERSGVPALAHLTCIGAKKDGIARVLRDMKAGGIDNVLALRGDRPQGMDELPESDFPHASDLVRFIKETGDFCVGCATYPEGHPESRTLDEDLENMKRKVDAGCDFLVTQMFFDNEMFYNFMYRLLAKGVRVLLWPASCRSRTQSRWNASLPSAEHPFPASCGPWWSALVIIRRLCVRRGWRIRRVRSWI